ncbi:unnamed protein product [Caenorhabditis auriculariae]|uniref:Uncharacterized protein n=1 Tax=Caenorhabditis auriculariae TaxID=2777116 RepID=A0A8S1GQ76_9PELO|nr:unnamed protein product [Caenorhabditis auriculariae]
MVRLCGSTSALDKLRSDGFATEVERRRAHSFGAAMERERPATDRFHCVDRAHCSAVHAHFSLHASSPSPSRQRPSLGGQSLDAANIRRFLSDKRRRYHNRSLGPTIASAPSVEQEDYRTPKPSFDKNGGKSFDFCGVPSGSIASDSNGLVKFPKRGESEGRSPELFVCRHEEPTL